jgi:hypothetical protein
MYGYFTNDCLSISLQRNRDNKLALHISSDYGNERYHKQQLYACEKRLAEELEKTWKAVKSKKLQSLFIGFGEIDHYDDMTNMYTTPTAYIKRGKRKAEISCREHGSIPKDWSVGVHAIILDTTTIGPVLQVIESVLDYRKYNGLCKDFNLMKKQLTKAFRPILQKKKDYVNFGMSDAD